MLKQNKKGFLQISFAWLFAIIVGAFILFLAIFAVTKIITTEQTESDVKTAKQIGVLLNPLETGFEVGKTTSLTFPIETRVYNRCGLNGVFGEQRIEISQKNFNKWSETDLSVDFANKYIFSEDSPEGRKFYLFSKPFNFPFKVADLIYMTSSSRNYCFSLTESEEDIEDELGALGQANIFLEDCPENSIDVCFHSGDCDINVNMLYNTVSKNNEVLFFEGNDALMYAAIFSDSETYDCQLERLMKRTSQLAQIYRDKETFISNRCNSNVGAKLMQLSNLVETLTESSQLRDKMSLVEDIEQTNDMNSRCRLW